MKKKIIIASVSVLCLVAVLFSVCWFVPVLRYEMFGTPLKTKTFFPKPDSVTGLYAMETANFSGEQGEAMHEALLQLMEQVSSCESTFGTSLDNNEFGMAQRKALRLNYEREYTLAGEVYGLSEPWGNHVFDAVVVVLYEDHLFVGPCYRDELAWEEQKGACGVTLYFSSGYDAFERSVEGALAAGLPDPFGIERTPVDPRSVEAFCVENEPNVIVFKKNGAAIQLNDAQKTQLHSAFIEVNEMQEGWPRKYLHAVKMEYTVTQAYKDLMENPCLEFRYDKRQKYEGIIAQTDPENPGESICYHEVSIEFDAVTFVILRDDAIRMILYKNGLYQGVFDTYHAISFGDQGKTFFANVLSLAEG